MGNSLLSPRNIAEGCLRIRFSGDRIFLAAGKPETTQSNRQTTEYHYISHRIKDETEYPSAFAANEILHVAVRYQAASSKAQISINGGPAVELTTGKILGLTFVGLLVGNGGQIRIASIKTDLK